MLNPRIAEALNVPQKTGMLVQHVVSGSLVDKAGLRGGDIAMTLGGSEFRLGGDVVLSIHGTVCDGPHNFSAIKDQITALKPGENFVIKVLRAGEVIDLFVKADADAGRASLDIKS